MNTVELIRKKRNGLPLTKSEIHFLINSYQNKKIPDYQFSAFLMAVYFRGMNETEQSALTDAMINSGKIVDLRKIKGVKVDKHSTGGVGDKTSMIIAPIAAAAGVKVPMISGRGLGHSGGTLDKLDSIPGFRTDLSLSQFKNILKKCGAVLIGQTKEIAPADKLIYALRDVTATVESIPLITGSIMSKKIAEGIDGLVLDVKTGSGAFMSDEKDAAKLAESLIRTAKSFDKKVIAFITDMNQPLGNYIGNWFEVHESIKVLQGENVEDLLELSLTLSGAMIYLGNKAGSIEEGKKISFELIKNGKAFEKFIEIVKNQGGDLKYIHNPDLYPKSKFSKKIFSPKTGHLSVINNYDIGMSALELGAGRRTKEDKIDPKAGIIFYSKIGSKINKGDVIAEVFTDNKAKLEIARDKILNSLTFSHTKTKKLKIIKKIIN
ncbi:MAG: thymidine phosphorylase [Ignavibacteria bacterium RIFOXYB2_FULL_35_12]|nr:MAG: thymidine phosphorylase [Ignavibacteria bacterium GWA2_36_19]OGU50697.1 MAG: thymidine phosphorylase [Ignavibacteria bacterium GWC2_35_8]OGU61840.1 MAG: thymidine phosphorylase [Ignavibacteria bacterium GWF2_35_20]OGU82677.1 MAG: thymidine phosphorylase [Ignavibacteria bacterium RIFOXYA2_FULL_35_9]OGU88248.1 MAG: thymidine phosphorylase [Ignavibacteria bacterium RIFOXYA12_FULL_35_25]OGU91264.1 MAG: thymidine phosphorylase [Ignavibacteria bacterium RIFOXYC12_FULL_35_11]OGU93206.1 MAG: 